MLDIQVQLSEGDISTLESYVREIKYSDVYVELGTAQGGSALIARDAADKDVEVYSIDCLDELHKKARDSKGINFIQDYSVKVAEGWEVPKRIGVLFIDGGHNEAGNDFLAWEKYLAEDAVILFHDYAPHSPNVIIDCDKLFKDNKKYKILYIPGKSPLVVTTSIYQVKKMGK